MSLGEQQVITATEGVTAIRLAPTHAAPQTQAIATIEPPSAVLDPKEIAHAREIVQQYSGYPGITEAFAAMVNANADNPERLTSLVRGLVEQIEQVKSNPHVHHPVDPAIAAAVEAIRKVELEKPDPLNLLRPEQQAEGKKPEVEPLTLGSIFAGPAKEEAAAAPAPTLRELFTAPIMALAAKEEPKTPEAVHPFAHLLDASVLASLASMNGHEQGKDHSAAEAPEGHAVAKLAALTQGAGRA